MEKQMNVISVRLVKDTPLFSDKPIEHPQDAVELLGKYLCGMDREVLCVVNLRNDGKPLNCNFVSMGSVNECLAHPRELLKSSVLCNACSTIIVHNHPSGKLVPSKNDTLVTDRMLQLGELMGIPLVDHIIVGGDNSSYFSFREKDIMPFNRNKFAEDYMEIDGSRFAVAESSAEISPYIHYENDIEKAQMKQALLEQEQLTYHQVQQIKSDLEQQAGEIPDAQFQSEQPKETQQPIEQQQSQAPPRRARHR